MATTHQELAFLDHVELCEPIHGAPTGAQGTVIGFINDGTVAEIEITEPELDGLDRIVYATPSQLRRINSPTPSAATHTPLSEIVSEGSELSGPGGSSSG